MLLHRWLPGGGGVFVGLYAIGLFLTLGPRCAAHSDRRIDGHRPFEIASVDSAQPLRLDTVRRCSAVAN